MYLEMPDETRAAKALAKKFPARTFLPIVKEQWETRLTRVDAVGEMGSLGLGERSMSKIRCPGFPTMKSSFQRIQFNFQGA